MSKNDLNVVAVIPARWDSTRFPGKILAKIAGEPMIAHVVRRASEACRVDHVIVATDDERIAEVAAASDVLVDGLLVDEDVAMSTLCRPLEAERIEDPNAVKVVRDVRGRALYFSRSPIPYPRHRDAAWGLWRLHLGVYGFRRNVLERFVALPPSELERAEGLEQLRALENGIPIQVLDAPHPAFGVDTPEDLKRVEQMMRPKMSGSVG